MANLPESWGLTTKPNERGTLDVLGKDDSGREYKVRTTDTPGITDTDVAELRAADREAYSSREEGCKTFIDNLVEHGRKQKESRDNAFHDDLTQATDELIGATKVRRGFVSRPDTIVLSEKFSFSHIPEWRWNLAFGDEN